MDDDNRTVAGHYHHGNLKEALLERALESLEQGDALPSLRALARGEGVTIASVYRHFNDREALVGELAERSFGALAERFEKALLSGSSADSQAEAADRFRALAQAYLEFATDQPNLFRIAFGPEAAAFRSRTRGSGGRPSTYSYLEKAISELYATGVILRPATVERVEATWWIVHGASALAVAGFEVLGGVDVSRIAAEVTEVALRQLGGVNGE